jgi:Fe2+ or Zn2+ uptake regulation protein
LVFATFKLVRQARKKGARLTPEGMAVLSLLVASSRALPATEITRTLQGAFPDGEWTIERTAAQLGALQKQRLNDGSVKAFCAEDAARNWSAVDPGLVI